MMDPHAKQPVVAAGPKPDKAAGTVVLLHGRGSSAENMLSIYDELGIAELAAIAPQAAGHTWYPNSFLAPIESNQPYLGSALARVESLIAGLMEQGIPAERIALLGFSQGACLTLESVARHPRRYGAVMGLTGGLIGPPGTTWEASGSLAGTSVFLGTSDPDPHVPLARVKETESVFRRMGADVELRSYSGMPHTINEEEVDVCRTLLQKMIK